MLCSVLYEHEHDFLVGCFPKWGQICHRSEIILAKKGRFIHVRSQISWYVCSMYEINSNGAS